MPAIIFDRLPEDHVVQMFVTINAKHTRLNASHLVSLSGRQLYRDDALATAHDVVRALNDRDDSPLYGEIKLLGVGRGHVAQAPLAQELKKAVLGRALHRAAQGRRRARGCQEVLRELLQADRARLQRRVERPQVQHPIRLGASRVRPCRAGRDPPARSGARRARPISAPSAASSRRGAGASATCASKPKGSGSAAARRSSRSPRN